MKTKITFEEADFKGSGQLIILDNFPDITTAYKLGYGYQGKNSCQVYYLIAMSDGMVTKQAETKEEMVDYLNQEDFRPMTKKEIIDIIGGQGNRFAPYSA